jgi:two-component system nitrogen regulation sensor histidine kinase NtrY
MAVVAIVPLLGTLILGNAVLREAYQVGVNDEVRSELERGLDLYRSHFISLRENADLIADAISNDWELRLAIESGDANRVSERSQQLFEKHRAVARIKISDSRGEIIVQRERRSLLDKSTIRRLELSRTPAALSGRLKVNVTVATDSSLFDDFQQAGELMKVYSQLESGTGFLSGVFLVVYFAFMLTVIVLSLAAGIVIARGVTRRVAVLSKATSKVGTGDLSVEVPSDTKDELGELTRAFNIMVRDLRESRGRIEYLQRISAWQEFARRLAHEIKNPLTPIQLAMQEVHRGYRGNDERYQFKLDEALSIIEEEVATLRRLVGEFSAFAKLPQARLEPADLNDLIHEASRSYISIAEEAIEVEGTDDSNVAVEICWEPFNRPLPVLIDSMMLKRCIDNLIRNSEQAIFSQSRNKRDTSTDGVVKSREHVSVPGRVRVRTFSDDDRAVLEIEDNGPGIVKENRDRVFDPYYTTNPDGTGLGLAIVKKIVLEHGGEIICSDTNLGGVSFRIQLPLAHE